MLIKKILLFVACALIGGTGIKGALFGSGTFNSLPQQVIQPTNSYVAVQNIPFCDICSINHEDGKHSVPYCNDCDKYHKDGQHDNFYCDTCKSNHISGMHVSDCCGNCSTTHSNGQRTNNNNIGGHGNKNHGGVHN